MFDCKIIIARIALLSFVFLNSKIQLFIGIDYFNNRQKSWIPYSNYSISIKNIK